MAENGEPREEGRGGIRNTLTNMTPGRRVLAGGLVALAVAGFFAAFLWINQPSYQVLYKDLAQADAAQVVDKLKELKVPYELDEGGTAIRVPEDQVHETRLALASQGVPTGGTVGFEVFNEIKMGTTEFVQQINYQRALQGELARTIASLSEVKEARVHIVLPRESLFVEDAKKPSAGVVLDLESGRSLTRSQIDGIVQLVASAVPDLTIEGVTVVDTAGNLLFKKEQDTEQYPAAQTASQLEHQRQIETQLKHKVQTMLEQFLGPGRAVVRVSADLDFTKSTTTQDLFNPDQVAVRSETRNTSQSQGSGNLPGGSPDQRFTLAAQNANPNEVSGGEQNKTEQETTNYEISRTQKTETRIHGGVKKLSVAVVVDGPYDTKTDDQGNTTRTFTPRSAEELRQITELVQRAVGYSQDRGDEVTVANVPFQMPTDLGSVASVGWQDYVKEYSKPVLNLILGILFIFLVARPALKYFMSTRAAQTVVVGGAGGPRAVGPSDELPSGMPDAEEEALLEEMTTSRKITVRDQILALAQQDPERATQVLRAYMHDMD